MHINYLLEIFKKIKKDAIIWNNSSYTYDWLLKNYNLWLQILKENSVKPGSVIVIHADFSPKAISLLLAAIELKTIIVHLLTLFSLKLMILLIYQRGGYKN